MQIETGHLETVDRNHWEAFRLKYPDDEHFRLACHAAFPVALTPDLLYKIWLNFRHIDVAVEPLELLTTVSDILHSPLCREIGRNTYEMHPDIRSALLEALQNDPDYKHARILELARFLRDYLRHNPDKLPNASFREAQNWVADSYLEPEKAAKIILDLLEQEDHDPNAANKVDFYLSWAKQRNYLHRSPASGAAGADILLAAEQIVQGFRQYRAGDLQAAVEKFRSIEPFIEAGSGHGFKTKIPGEVWKVLKPAAPVTKTSSVALQVIEKEKRERTGRLDLGNCGLIEIPLELFELHWLEELDLSNNQLRQLSKDISQMAGLKYISLDYNQFDVFPDALLSLKILEKISLAENLISLLPSKIVEMAQLKELNLRGNPMSLPYSIWLNDHDFLNKVKESIGPGKDPKIFLFCLGGTGARVLKSLIFLLAAGVNLKAGKVIPIIIDTDTSNGDVQRTIDILRNYQEIRRQLEFKHNGFFKTDIQTLASLVAPNTQISRGLSQNFRFDIDGSRDATFRHFIGYDTMSPANRAITDALFSEKDLQMELSAGLGGNAHIGSVVLNQFKDSVEFKYFASQFGHNDRIFIVSSIFGGTGAAGFPLLVKNIREATGRLSNHDRLRNAPIGAIAVAPYFGVEPDDTIIIDKNTFIDRTKAALEYYSDHVTGNRSLNALYYIGDQVTSDYKPAAGKAEQTNNAHVIELFSALSIFDFMNLTDADLACIEGRAETPYFKEYGIRGDEDRLTLQNIGPTSKQLIVKPLTQYALAVNFWSNHFSQAIQKPDNWARNKKSPIQINFLNFLKSSFYHQHLQLFNRYFKEWLVEMARNTRAIEAFNLDTSLLHTLVNGYVPMKKNFFGGVKPDEWSYDHYNYELNVQDARLPTLEVEKRFMALFYKTTEKIIQDKFKGLSD